MRIGQAIYRTLTLLALLAFIGYFVIYAMYAAALFRFPLEYDQGEGFELNDAILFSRGQWPYRDNHVYPFYASNYPPLFHLAMVPLVLLLGPRLLAGRLLSFASTLVIGAVVGWIVQRQTRRAELAALCGLMVLASNYVYHIGPLARLHMTMVMFELLAIAFLAQSHHARHATRNLAIGLIMLTCAGWTKQLALSTVVAGLAYLLWRSPRRAIVAGAILAAVNGLLFLAVNAATGGQWFVNIIQANINAYDVEQAISLYRQWFRLHGVILLLAAGYVLYELKTRNVSAYSVWFVASVANAALAGKWGAGESYFTTAVVAACVLAGLALSQMASTPGLLFKISGFAARAGHNAAPRASPPTMNGTWVKFLIPIAFLVQAALVLHLPTDGQRFGPLADLLGIGRQASVYPGYSYYDSGGYTQLGHLVAPRDHAAADKLLAYVRASPGPALTEEAALSILAGKPVVGNPTQLLNLYKNGLYDPSGLIEMIEARRFGVIVLRAQFYPVPVLQAIGQNYWTVEEVIMNGFVYRVLKPRLVY